jgi:hypothetical protein
MPRRERTFPMRLVKIEPTPSNPSGVQMFYAHEWEAYQKSLQPDQPSDEPAQPTDAIAETTTELANAVAGSPSESAISSVSSASFASPASRGFSLPPDFSRHARRCAVCSHPDRDAIEGDFIRWRSPGMIARDYKIADRSSIYRHAHSTGLFAWRRRELGRVLESVLESCEDIPLESADVIIRAARIYAHLDEHGKWSEPARINFILTGPAPANLSLGAIEPSGLFHLDPRDAQGSLPIPGGDISEQPIGEEKVNRNSGQIKNSVNSLNPEEKANS